METTRFGACATVTEVDPSNSQATVALLGGKYELNNFDSLVQV